MNIIRYSIRSFFTNEYYSIIRFASKRLFVATLVSKSLFYGGVSFGAVFYFFCRLAHQVDGVIV